MKKNYTFLFAILLLFGTQNLFGAKFYIAVSNSIGVDFAPANTSGVHINDSVIFIAGDSPHSVASTTIPASAVSFSFASMAVSTQYVYVPLIAGTYNFQCTAHSPAKTGLFTVVSSSGVNEISTDLITSVYPNPCTDKLLIKYKGITNLDVYNVIGDKLKSIQLSGLSTTAEIDITELPSGVYFLRTSKEGIIVETKKIVKSK